MRERIAEQVIDTAWRIHDAQIAWTSQVDSKASFVLAIEAAVIGGVVTLAGDGHRLTGLEQGWTLGIFVLGVVLLIGALVSVALVVRPRLRNADLVKEADTNYIFFGHAKQYDPDKLRTALETGDILGVLSRQIVEMSKIAWQKHRLLQLSVTLATFGSAFIALAAALNGK